MKIIYLANLRLPTEKAHGIQIMKMCEAFTLLKQCEVELIVPRRLNKIKQDPFEYYSVKRLFKITRIPCFDLVRIGKIGFLIQTASFLIFSKIYLVFKRCDIFYTREQFAGLFFRWFVLEMHKLPNKVNFWHKKIWHRAEKIIVLTSLIKKELIKIGISGDKIFIASDAVDLKQFSLNISAVEAKEKLGLPLNKHIIAYTGSFYLYDWKGIDILLESVKYFSAEGHCFLLVGGNKNEADKIKNKYNLNNIMLVSRKPHGEVPNYLKAADVLVLPNKKGDEASEKYTSPLKLFEYMASGRPIVASDLPSIREILNENNSILVEPNSPEKLADGIKSVLQDKDLSDKISKQALEDAQNYTWEKRAENIINFANCGNEFNAS